MRNQTSDLRICLLSCSTTELGCYLVIALLSVESSVAQWSSIGARSWVYFLMGIPNGHSDLFFDPRLYEYPKKNETKQRMPFLNSYGGCLS